MVLTTVNKFYLLLKIIMVNIGKRHGINVHQQVNSPNQLVVFLNIRKPFTTN